MNKHPRASGPSSPAVWRRQLATLEQQARAWWKARSAQERRLLRLCAIVVAAALAWVLGLQPALKTIAESRDQLPRLHADAAQVHAYILEAQALQRSPTGKIDGTDLTQALRASLRRAGLDDAFSLSETGGAAARQWEVSLFNANAARVMEWLAGLPYLLQLQTATVELARANVEGRDRPGHVSGRIIVRQPAKDQP